MVALLGGDGGPVGKCKCAGRSTLVEAGFESLEPCLTSSSLSFFLLLDGSVVGQFPAPAICFCAFPTVMDVFFSTMSQNKLSVLSYFCSWCFVTATKKVTNTPPNLLNTDNKY